MLGLHGGLIVAEYFDEGQSRSLPWIRRPQASALLADLHDHRRPFDAVVIGEPARAFYGNQFSPHVPCAHPFRRRALGPRGRRSGGPGQRSPRPCHVALRRNVEGRASHVQIRVRAAMGDQARREGRFMGGRPPYGYQLVDAGPHPNPSKAADGRRLRRLGIDPVATPIVQRIFAEYLAGAGLKAIAEGA